MRYEIMALAAALVLAVPAAHADEGWTKVHEKNGIVVSVRPRAGSPIYEMRAVGEVAAPLDRVRAVIADMERYPDFMPPTSAVQLLRRDGNTFLYYMELNPPVVARRDYCLRLVWDALPGGGWHCSWEADNKNCLPERRRVVRVHENEGEWFLEPTAGGVRTHLLYRAHVDIAGHVPAWLVNRVFASALLKVFAAVQRTVGQPRYSAGSPEPASSQ